MRGVRIHAIAGLVLGLALTFTPPAAAEPPAFDAVNPNQTEPGPSARIVGGEPAYVRDHPFVIAMLREGGARPQGQTCTAAVVAPRVIVTAAHCKDGEGAKSMLYGSDDLTGPGGTKIGVAQYFQHPNYSPPNGWQTGWDVGIVVTTSDIPVPAGYQYPRVAGSGDSALTAPGKSALLLGYGRIRDGENQYGHLKKVSSYPIVDGASTCGSFGSFNPSYMVCGGYSDGHDGICQGDSGGPMLVDGVIVGVASWVKVGCNSYGAWGRLTNSMGDWANQLIDEHSGEPGEPGKPTASFTVFCQWAKCDFNGTGSSDPDNDIASYAWNFGDGQSGTAVTAAHTYPNRQSTYTATLTVTDRAGNRGTATKQIQCWSIGAKAFCFGQ